MQIIPWGKLAGKAGVLPDSCGGGALHEFEVYSIGMGTRSDTAFGGFLIIKKIISG
jgi:hypothetical protein